MSATANDVRGWGFREGVTRIKRHRTTPISFLNASMLEFALRFAEWAASLPEPPSADAIREYWEVSRATAYRWRSAWRSAKGLK